MNNFYNQESVEHSSNRNAIIKILGKILFNKLFLPLTIISDPYSTL